MAVALHVAADDGPVEDVERSEQGRGAMALVVVRHGAEPALLQRQARLGAIESLDLALLVERKHDGVGRRIDIEPDHVAQLVDEVRIVRELELPITVRLKPVRLPDAPDRAGADAARPCHQIGGPMGGLAGGSASVSATTRAATSGPSGGMREGRVLSCRRPSMPSFMNVLPAPDAGLRLAGPAHDLVGADTVGAREDDRRPPSVFLRGVTVPGDRFEFGRGRTA